MADDARLNAQVEHLLQTDPPTPWRRIRKLTGANNHVIAGVRNRLATASASAGAFPERSPFATTSAPEASAADSAHVPVPADRAMVPVPPDSMHLVPAEQTPEPAMAPGPAWGLGGALLAAGAAWWLWRRHKARTRAPVVWSDDLGTRFLVGPDGRWHLAKTGLGYELANPLI